MVPARASRRRHIRFQLSITKQGKPRKTAVTHRLSTWEPIFSLVCVLGSSDRHTSHTHARHVFHLATRETSSGGIAPDHEQAIPPRGRAAAYSTGPSTGARAPARNKYFVNFHGQGLSMAAVNEVQLRRHSRWSSSAASRRRALARRVWGAPKGASRDREPYQTLWQSPL